MNTFYSADYVLPVTGGALKNGVVEVTDQDMVCAVYASDSPSLAGQPIKRHSGIITPGFINSHCHLELSHLAGVIPKLTGLVPFLQRVIALRTADHQQIHDAMEHTDQQLYDRGVVAVGDHANTALSAAVKAQSKIHYHTFVEVIGFETELASQKIAEATTIVSQFPENKVSITGHAPYSVSKDLFKQISEIAVRQKVPLSIHNQESEEENRLFRYKNGRFLDFYAALGRDITDFKAQARNSIQTLMPYLSPENSVMLVHNTYTSTKDIFFVERQGRKVTWCFCPNANLYIEGNLPKVSNFTQYRHNVTLGTDSLASNDKLCILSELKTIHTHFPGLPLTETIKWATINGARLLNIDETYGSLEPGKTPGLNLLTNTDGLTLTRETDIVRLI